MHVYISAYIYRSRGESLLPFDTSLGIWLLTVTVTVIPNTGSSLGVF